MTSFERNWPHATIRAKSYLIRTRSTSVESRAKGRSFRTLALDSENALQRLEQSACTSGREDGSATGGRCGPWDCLKDNVGAGISHNRHAHGSRFSRAQKTATPPTLQEAITPLMSKDLKEFPGKEIVMYTVVFPSGFSTPIDHNAYVSVYMLEGSVVMQVRGGKGVTLTPGQSFYEAPTTSTSLAAMPAVQGQQNPGVLDQGERRSAAGSNSVTKRLRTLLFRKIKLNKYGCDQGWYVDLIGCSIGTSPILNRF